MNKTISTTILLLIALLFGVSFFVSALSPMYVPKCFIKGEIMGVDFFEAYDGSEPMLPAPSYPDRFVLNILIYETKLIGEWEKDYDTCEEMYPVNIKRKIYIPASEVSENDILIGRIIEGDVNNDFGPNFQKFSLLPEKEIKPEPKPGPEKDKDDKEDGKVDIEDVTVDEEYEKDTKRDISLVIIFIAVTIFATVFYKLRK